MLTALRRTWICEVIFNMCVCSDVAGLELAWPVGVLCLALCVGESQWPTCQVNLLVLACLSQCTAPLANFQMFPTIDSWIKLYGIIPCGSHNIRCCHVLLALLQKRKNSRAENQLANRGWFFDFHWYRKPQRYLNFIENISNVIHALASFFLRHAYVWRIFIDTHGHRRTVQSLSPWRPSAIAQLIDNTTHPYWQHRRVQIMKKKMKKKTYASNNVLIRCFPIYFSFYSFFFFISFSLNIY